jgi:hypothetical protein
MSEFVYRMLVKMLEMIAGIQYCKSITYAGESYVFKPTFVNIEVHYNIF